MLILQGEGAGGALVYRQKCRQVAVAEARLQ